MELAVSIFSANLPAHLVARVLAVMGFISVGFYFFLLFTSNPFDRSLPFFPSEGADLNPLLQDPWLAFHPPFLYLGYVGLSIVWSFALSGLFNWRPIGCILGALVEALDQHCLGLSQSRHYAGKLVGIL